MADINGNGNKRVFTTAPLRSINEIMEDLHKPVHPRHLKTRMQGNKELTYITWFDTCKYLDLYAPGWDYEVKSIQLIAKDVVIIAKITIPTAEGLVSREATGCESSTTDSYGDPYSNSESMALRRAASKFGLAQHLYRDK